MAVETLIKSLTKELTTAYEAQARAASRAKQYGEEIAEHLSRPVEQQYGLTVYLNGNPITDFNEAREAVDAAQQRLMTTMLTLECEWSAVQDQIATAKMLMAERYPASRIVSAMRVKSRKPPAEYLITSLCVTSSRSSAVPTIV